MPPKGQPAPEEYLSYEGEWYGGAAGEGAVPEAVPAGGDALPRNADGSPCWSAAWEHVQAVAVAGEGGMGGEGYEGASDQGEV